MDAQRNPRRAWVWRGAAALLVAVVVTASGAAPAKAQTAPFITDPAVNHLDPDGTPNGIVVVGDDMFVNGGITYDADVIGDFTGSSVWLSAANRASWPNYYAAGEQNGHSTMSAYADFFDAHLTVSGLAKNDARIMTQSPASYSGLQHYLVTYAAVSDTRAHSQCVMLVNMPERSGVAGVSVANAQAVNNNLAHIAANHPSGDVYLADWKSYSAGSTGWFVAGSAQLTALGAQSYAVFVAVEAHNLVLYQGC